MGDWTVWGPKWNPEVGVGQPLTSCTSCLDMPYSFTFSGKTVQFDETYVDAVVATPQVRHVVLHDTGDGMTYTGSLPAEHYFPWAPDPSGPWPKLYRDRIDYELKFDKERKLVDFRYLEYEHKKM